MDLDAVAEGAAQDAGGLDIALLGRFLDSVVDAAATGRRLNHVELERCSERGAAAATAGVPPRALVDLYLSACWRLWSELPAVSGGTAEQVRAAGLGVLRAADDGVAALADGFQRARGDLSRREESARQEVFDALLAGGPESAAVLGRAADLGLDLTSPHAVLVAEAEVAFDDPATAGVPSRLERALQGRHGDAQPLVAQRNGQLVCIFAAPGREAVSLVGNRLGDVMAGVLPGGGRSGGRRTWQAAVGPTLAGPQGIRASYDQARGTLDLAARLDLTDAVVEASQVAVYRVLLRDRAAVHELITTTLSELTRARGGAGPLLETLDVYYATGGVATVTADRLHLSVRAVTYRLQRVRELIGTDPSDPAEGFTLQTAVRAARLLRWPEQPFDHV